MDIDQLRTFVEVARRGSVTAAAQELGLQQPTVSHRLAALERSVGAPLFERLGTGLVLTAAGHALLPYGATLPTIAAEALRAARVAAGLSAARLHIGCAETPATYLLPDALRRLRQDHPALEVRLTVGNAARVLAVTLSGEVDVAVLTSREQHPRLQSETVRRDRFVVVVAADDPWALPDVGNGSSRGRGAFAALPARPGVGVRPGTSEQPAPPDSTVAEPAHGSHGVVAGRSAPAAVPVSDLAAVSVGDPAAVPRRIPVRDLATRRLLLRESGAGTRAFVDAALKAAGVQAGETLEVASLEALKRMAEAGVGVAVVPLLAVEREAREGRLRVLDLDLESNANTLDYCLMRHRDKLPVPGVDVFRAALTHPLGDDMGRGQGAQQGAAHDVGDADAAQALPDAPRLPLAPRR